MNFLQAVLNAHLGDRIRRPHWHPEASLIITRDYQLVDPELGDIAKFGGINPCDLSIEDLNATDWQVA